MGKKGKGDSSIQLVSLFMAFLRSGGRKSCADTAAAGAKFQAYCETTAKSVPEVVGLPGAQQMYELFFLEPLVHVASILGGLSAQEVIKAITKRDVPMSNCVCFNAQTSTALIERVPAAQAKKKQKVEE